MFTITDKTENCADFQKKNQHFLDQIFSNLTGEFP